MIEDRSRRRTPLVRLNWRRPGLGLVVSAILALLVLPAPPLLALLGQPSAPGGWLRAEGYNRLVDELVIGRDWLRLSADGRSIVESEHAPASGEALRIWRRFKQNTYLGRDMEEASRWVLLADEGDVPLVAAIDPAAHQVTGPYGDATIWQGDILYRTGTMSAPTLIRERGDGPPARYAFRTVEAGNNTARRASIALFPSEPVQPVSGAWRYSLTSGAGGADGPDCLVADVMLIGDGGGGALLRLPSQTCADVIIRGRVQRTPAEEVRYAVLREGESLIVRGADGRRERFAYSAAPARISAADGRGVRERRAGLESFGLAVESMMDPGRRTDVRTTLDMTLQSVAAEVLAQGAEQGGRSAATIIDALSGEVLAIATLPLPASDGPALIHEGLDNRNHNFDLMPIGSVAKAPISLALVETYPELAGLVVEGGLTAENGRQGFRSIYGIDLGQGPRARPGLSFTDTYSSDSVEFRQFLAHSSNRYAVALMLLGLRNGDLEGCAPLSQPPIACWPEGLIDAETATDYGHPLLRYGMAATPDWGSELGRLFDIQYEYSAQASPREGCEAIAAFDRHDGCLWSGQAGMRARLSYPPAVFMERENLGLDHIANVREDYLMSILGGARSRWSTLKLAEVFARIVTRRRVSAHLVGQQPAEPFAPLLGTSATPGQRLAWDAVVGGLREVGLTGTASGALADLDLNRGLYRVFAKSGTPAIETSRGATPASQAAARLARLNCGLIWDGQAIRLAGQPITGGADLAEVLGRLKPVCRSLIQRTGLERVAVELARMARAPRQRGVPIGLTVAGDRIVRIAPDYAVSGGGDGHVIAFVVARYADPSDPDDRPVRALSIVINHQRPTSPGAATRAARELLQSEAVRAWMAGGFS